MVEASDGDEEEFGALWRGVRSSRGRRIFRLPFGLRILSGSGKGPFGFLALFGTRVWRFDVLRAGRFAFALRWGASKVDMEARSMSHWLRPKVEVQSRAGVPARISSCWRGIGTKRWVL